MPIKINSTGGGSVTIDASNTPLNTTLTLPATSGTFVFTGGNNTIQYAAGSANTPSITRFGDTNTGMFFPAADTIAFSEGGTEALRINSSAQIEFTAGTVSLPSITTSGDTNTGMFFPAADTIAFAEGGVEAMRLDSSGRVGIGTTSPAVRLNVNSGSTDEIARFDASSASNPYISLYRQGTRMSFWYAPGGTYTELGSEGRPLYLTTSSGTHAMLFLTDSTERMRISGGGSVGIGTSSPATRLHVVAADGVTNTRFSGASYALRIQSLATLGCYVDATDNTEATYQPLIIGGSRTQFTTSGTERMRIHAAGDVSIGITTAYYTNTNRGTLTVGGTTDGLVAVSGGGVASGYLYGSATVLSLVADAKPLQLAASGANVISLITNGTERARVTSDGHFVPMATNTYDLGASSNRWRNIFTQDLHLSNGIGDYTVIEGEENLYIVNNKSKKSFKFALIEVDPKEVPPKSGD